MFKWTFEVIDIQDEFPHHKDAVHNIKENNRQENPFCVHELFSFVSKSKITLYIFKNLEQFKINWKHETLYLKKYSQWSLNEELFAVGQSI